MKICQIPGVKCAEIFAKTGYRPYPQVGRSTLVTVGGFRRIGMRQIVRFVIRDSLSTRAAQTLSCPCIDTSKKLGTCDEMAKR